MRAARIVAPKKIQVAREKKPDMQDGSVMVRLEKTVICGSDFPYFSMEFAPESYPLPAGYPGHECLGTVVQSDSDKFHDGDRVMYYPTALDGYKEYHVNTPDRIQKLPDMGDPNILVMTQLLGAVAHCVFRIDSPYNQNVVIVGQGPVGLYFTALMKNFGARRIIAVDPLEYRLKTAKVMGATEVLHSGKDDIIRSVSDITDGNMADIVIEACGQNLDAINLSFDLTRHDGQVAFFGICLEESPRLNFNTFFRKELRLISSVGPDLTIDYPYALDMIIKGAIDPSPLITHIMPFEEIQKGFEMAVNRQENIIKAILEF